MRTRDQLIKEHGFCLVLIFRAWGFRDNDTRGTNMKMRLTNLFIVLAALGMMVMMDSVLTAQGTENGEWRSYGGDIANTRYSGLAEISAENFGDLEVAWRVNTSKFGPNPE